MPSTLRDNQKQYDALKSQKVNFVRLLFVDLAGIRRCRWPSQRSPGSLHHTKSQKPSLHSTLMTLVMQGVSGSSLAGGGRGWHWADHGNRGYACEAPTYLPGPLYATSRDTGISHKLMLQLTRHASEGH